MYNYIYSHSLQIIWADEKGNKTVSNVFQPIVNLSNLQILHFSLKVISLEVATQSVMNFVIFIVIVVVVVKLTPANCPSLNF